MLKATAQAAVRAERDSVRWVREWTLDGRRRLRVGRDGPRLIADWDGLGRLSVAPDGAGAVVTPAPEVDVIDEARWRAGAVRAFLRHLEGQPTLHASAVSLGGRAVAFLADSGGGKSTCAADLCQRLGAELVTDDLAELSFTEHGVFLQPTDDHHWLLGDSAATLGHALSTRRKGGVHASRVASTPRPLAALVVLTFHDGDGAPALTRTRGHAAFDALSAGYARFLVDDKATQLRDLDVIARIAAAVPVCALSRPRSFEALAQAAVLVQPLFALPAP